MDAKQTLNILDSYFNTIEVLGAIDSKEYVILLYLMFIDEYYEFNRDISLKDINNNEIGLTDCLVKKLNYTIECLKSQSNILQSVELDYLPGKNHWIIPDSPVEDNDYIEGSILYTTSSIINNIFETDKHIDNNILEL